jgi:hypothetical protein
MTDDLVAKLRAEGHETEAASFERKLSGEPAPPPTIDAFGGDDADAEAAAVVAALDRDIPEWRR